jgi:hypothetical protein
MDKIPGDKFIYPHTEVRYTKLKNTPHTIPVKLDHPGLTIREEFAKAAMQGMLGSDTQFSTKQKVNHEWIAEIAVMYSDALIKALNKEK